MTQAGLPEKPSLRPVETKLVRHRGETYLMVSDPRRLTKEALLLPARLARYLALADGKRTVTEIASAGTLPGTPAISARDLMEVFRQLDTLLLLENGRYRAEINSQLREYRAAPCRPPALAGSVYAADADQLDRQLNTYAGSTTQDKTAKARDLSAVITPHIDYARGGRCYAETWSRAAPLLQEVELAVIFGTDHNGAGPRLTLTRQSYSTPWGVTPTDRTLVDRLAGVLAQDPDLPGHPFEDEANHIGEHSVELAVVWLHHAVRKRPVQVLPVLCGSLHAYVTGAGGRLHAGHKGLPDDIRHISEAIAVLKEVARERRTVFVAAADFAHVGPAFGDQAPFRQAERRLVRDADVNLLEAISRGDRHGFLTEIRRVTDANRICGMAPIYMALWAADGPASGEWFGYEQCPADASGGSFVSIAGALLYRG